MPKSLDPIWQHFVREKDGSRHGVGYCRKCLATVNEDKALYRAHKYPVISGQKNRLASHIRTCENVAQSVKDQYPILSKRKAETDDTDVTTKFSSSSITAHELNHPRKRKLTHTITYDTILTEEEQKQFNNQVLKGTIAAGLPLRWVEHIECIKLFSMVRQQAKLPSQQQLTGHVLERVYEEVQGSDLKVLRECDGLTVVFDGLNDIRGEHLVGAGCDHREWRLCDFGG